MSFDYSDNSFYIDWVNNEYEYQEVMLRESQIQNWIMNNRVTEVYDNDSLPYSFITTILDDHQSQIIQTINLFNNVSLSKLYNKFYFERPQLIIQQFLIPTLIIPNLLFV